jgi:hypothetical protein
METQEQKDERMSWELFPDIPAQIASLVRQDQAQRECPQEYLIRWVARFIEADEKPLNRLQCAVRFMDAVMDAFDEKRVS